MSEWVLNGFFPFALLYVCVCACVRATALYDVADDVLDRMEFRKLRLLFSLCSFRCTEGIFRKFGFLHTPLILLLLLLLFIFVQPTNQVDC